MFIGTTGAKLANFGFVHITGLKAVGGLQNINAPKLSQEERVIVSTPAWAGHYHTNASQNMVVLFTYDGEVWLGDLAQFNAATDLLSQLCPSGEMQGGYPLIGAMRLSDLFERKDNPTCGLLVKDCEMQDSPEEPDSIAVVPPAGQALETGAGGEQSAKAA